MKKKQPKTIADLDIIWTFSNYLPWLCEQEFQILNPNLTNLKIISNSYKFVIEFPFALGKDSFRILISEPYSQLWWLMNSIDKKIQEYSKHFPKFDNKLVLDKFVKINETTFEIVLK